MAAATHVSAVLPAGPDAVFATLTDLARLPDWNAAMTSVVDQHGQLEVGAEWVVEFRALGQRWRSRSTVEELDVAARRFAYRSGTDDGNPSYAPLGVGRRRGPRRQPSDSELVVASRHVLAAGTAGAHTRPAARPYRDPGLPRRACRRNRAC